MKTDRISRLRRGDCFADCGLYHLAIAEYERLASEPSDAWALQRIAWAQTCSGKHEAAVATFEKAAQRYAAQGCALQAISAYRQARRVVQEQVRNSAEKWLHLLPRIAELSAQRASVSGTLIAYDAAANELQHNRRWHEAIEFFRKMVAVEPSNPIPHWRLAEACCKVEDTAEALESMRTAIDLLVQLDRWQDALRVIERALQLDSDLALLQLSARLYLEVGQREEGYKAIAKLQACFAENPEDVGTLGLLVRAFRVIGQPEKALEVQKELVRLSARDGDQKLAAALIGQLKALATNDPEIQALASQLGQSGRGQSPSDTTSTAGLRAKMASITEDVGSMVEEESSLSEISALSDVSVVSGTSLPEQLPDSAKRAIADAELFSGLRLFSKAFEVLYLELDRFPDSLELREKLCQVLKAAGDIERASTEQTTLAALYVRLGDAARAKPLLTELLRHDPNNRTATTLLERLKKTPSAPSLAENRPVS